MKTQQSPNSTAWTFYFTDSLTFVLCIDHINDKNTHKPNLIFYYLQEGILRPEMAREEKVFMVKNLPMNGPRVTLPMTFLDCCPVPMLDPTRMGLNSF